jgi:hypothetical protein
MNYFVRTRMKSGYTLRHCICILNAFGKDGSVVGRLSNSNLQWMKTFIDVRNKKLDMEIGYS